MNENNKMQAIQNDVQSDIATQINESDEISLFDLLLILWKGKFIIAACALLVTIAGIIYALLAPEVFSTSTVFITKTGKL